MNRANGLDGRKMSFHTGSRRSQPPLALAVPLSRFASRVGGGSAFYVRRHSHTLCLGYHYSFCDCSWESVSARRRRQSCVGIAVVLLLSRFGWCCLFASVIRILITPAP